MQICFDKCSDALDFAIRTKSFAVFHSTENNPNTNIHTHECCEIFLCLKGGNNFLIDDKVYDVCNGDLFFMNQYESHKITFLSDTDIERWLIQIHPEFIFRFSTEKTDLSKCLYTKHNKIHLAPDELTLFTKYFTGLATEYEFGDDIMKQSIMLQMLTRLNTLALQIGACGGTLPENPSLRLALEYINFHFTENISLETVARNSYISVNQLCRLFRLHLGTTVSKYIVSKRISEAKKCLKKGLSVSVYLLPMIFSLAKIHPVFPYVLKFPHSTMAFG